LNLIGNHELMNLQGDLRYVHPNEFSDAMHYGGYEPRKRAWSPGGALHKDFRERYLATSVIDQTLFVHGGLEPSIIYAALQMDAKTHPLDTINNKIKDLMGKTPMPHRVAKDKFANQLMGSQGPFWSRLFAEEHASIACAEIKRTLQLVNATRMVVGHTPQTQGVQTRCGDSIILADTIISEAYRPVFGMNRPSAVLLEHGASPVQLLFPNNKIERRGVNLNLSAP